MGIELVYSAGDAIHQSSMSNVDYQLLGLFMEDESLADSVAAIMNTVEFGEPCTIERDIVIESIKQILVAIDSKGAALPYTYGTRMSPMPGLLPVENNYGGGVHGIRINGEVYGLDTRLGVCKLSRYEVNEDNTGRIVEVIDLRSTKSIQTDNMGKIIILRRKKKTQLKQILNDLLAFLESRPEETVTKLVG